jgi:hypothetical protein
MYRQNAIRISLLPSSLVAIVIRNRRTPDDRNRRCTLRLTRLNTPVNVDIDIRVPRIPFVIAVQTD